MLAGACWGGSQPYWYRLYVHSTFVTTLVLVSLMYIRYTGCPRSYTRAAGDLSRALGLYGTTLGANDIYEKMDCTLRKLALALGAEAM